VAKISEYWDDPGSENVKLAVDNLYKELQKSLPAEGIIKIQAKESNIIIRQLVKIRSVLIFRKVDLTRISFAI
jgi:hypothetical protein